MLNEHHENCDMFQPAPDLGPSQKLCNCKLPFLRPDIFAVSEWKSECARWLKRLNEVDASEDDIIFCAEQLRCRAFEVKGIACQRCGGQGRKCYGSTATWHGGCGGQKITEDVCDLCWGTGRTDIIGENLRTLINKHKK